MNFSEEALALDFAYKEFGKRSVIEIKAPEILDALRRIEKRGRHETATRARSTIGAVFRFAIATGRAEPPHADQALANLGAYDETVQ